MLVRSSAAGEGITLADGFDAAFVIRSDLALIPGNSILIIMFTDSEILFNIITRRSTTTEKRMTVDLEFARAA